MKKIALRVAVIAIGFAITSAFAGDLEDLSAKITKNMPGLKIDSLAESPVPGLYELVSGGDVAYVTADGVHLIQGTMFNVPEKKNVSEATLAKLRVKEMASIDKKKPDRVSGQGREGQAHAHGVHRPILSVLQASPSGDPQAQRNGGDGAICPVCANRNWDPDLAPAI